MPLKRLTRRTNSNFWAAMALTLGAVHVEACVPALVQFATDRPDAPAALIALAFDRFILSTCSYYSLVTFGRD